MALALQLLRLPATASGSNAFLVLRQPCRRRIVALPLHFISTSFYSTQAQKSTSSTTQAQKSTSGTTQAQKSTSGTKSTSTPPEQSDLSPTQPVLPPKVNCPYVCTPPTPHNTASDNVNWSKWPPAKVTTASAKTTAKQKLSSGTVRQNVRGYIFKHVFDYITNYDKLLEKNFPSAFRIYRTFVDGVKYFYQDLRRFIKISRIVNSSPEGLKALNRKELELYMQMPRDMVKVAPSVIGASLPIVGYAILPLVFMFPKQCLSYHFWSIQQRAEFQQAAMQVRLKTNRPVLRQLQSKLKAAKSNKYHEELRYLLGLLGSGFHPSVEMLLNVKDIFMQPPYSLLSLKRDHLKLLCRIHGLGTGWFKRYRLSEHAFMVHHMDLAIMREGGVHNLHPDDLRRACFIRGLNPSNMSNEKLIEWLRDWIAVSSSINENHISLFLHLPILLAYNHPNNWQLIYG